MSITPFDDFAKVFIDWLLGTPILSDLWQGNRVDITTPDEDLFAEAAPAAEHHGYWEDDDAQDEDGGDEDEDDDAVKEDGYWGR